MVTALHQAVLRIARFGSNFLLRIVLCSFSGTQVPDASCSGFATRSSPNSRAQSRRKAQVAWRRSPQDRQTLEAESERAGSVRRALFTEDAGEVDKELDPQVASIYNVLWAQSQGNAAIDPLVSMAARMQKVLFPDGLSAVIRLPYVRQAAEVERIVEKLQNEFAADVVALSLSSKVARLAELSVAYRRAVNATIKERTFDEVREARERGHRLFLITIGAILAAFPDEDNAEHLTKRAQYLKPVFDEEDQLRARRKARRRGKGGAAGEAEAEDTADTGDVDDVGEVEADGSDAASEPEDTKV